MIDLRDKRVLVTGAAGLLGRPLVDKLIARDAIVTGAALDEKPADWPAQADYMFCDFSYSKDCQRALQDQEYVFHLAGAKGGVGIGRAKAADFLRANLVSTLQIFHEFERCKTLKRILFTSSVGAYPGEQEIFVETGMEFGPPHPSDYFGGYAKRLGEVLCKAYREQYGLDYVIVRPTNCYGPYDRFDPETGMVVAALIARIESGESPLVVWGDGTASRDFLYSKDAAEGMLRAMERGVSGEAYNLGTGGAIKLNQLVSLITGRCAEVLEVVFDASKPTGPRLRAMSMAKSFGQLGNFLAYDNLDGIGRALDETIAWYRANKEYKKYDPFK